MSVIADSGLTTIEGYDLQAEKERYRFPDLTYGGMTLNRGTARVELQGDMETPEHQAARDEHHQWAFLTTHDDGAPVVELGYPTAGPYVACRAGVYLDVMLGCAQKIFDEHHPKFVEAIDAMAQYGLLFRREINTDDYWLAPRGIDGIRTSQDLARILCETAQKSFPAPNGYRVFFSNSGTEAIEAALKLAYVVKYKKLVEKYGFDVLEKVMRQLGIPRDVQIDKRTPEKDPLYVEYPFVVFGTVGAFHGRTLGALAFTESKKAHKFGYPITRWARHIAFNGDPRELADSIDPRPLDQIADGEGGVAKVFAEGRVPADLAAGFIAEGVQGEGGYAAGNPEFFRAIAETCRRHEMMIIDDEVQSFARTGRVFSFEHLGIQPDVIAIAKCAVVGVTIARAEYEKYLHGGWHSNTFGGGKVYDTCLSYATLDALMNYEDPVLAGRPYLENQEIKGQYLRGLLERLAEKHPDYVTGFSGYGVMNGVTVRRREDLIALAWKRGLKILGCGPSGETARIRTLFLADCLTKEIEEFVQVLDSVIQELKTGA